MSGNSTGFIVNFVKCHIFILCDLWRNLKYIELTFICDKSRFLWVKSQLESELWESYVSSGSLNRGI